MTPEIRAFEYAAGLFAVLIGLAVVDIASSFHRLLRRRRLVRWDPLALAAALYALCLVVAMWFDLWGVRHFEATRTFPFYVPLIAQFMLLFLVGAASLPDEATGNLDLKEYYRENRAYFWTLVTLFQLLYVAAGLYFSRGEPADTPRGVLVVGMILMCLPLMLSLTMLLTKARGVHYVGLGLLFIVLALHYGRAAIM